MANPLGSMGNGWVILPISIPPLPSYPKSTTHHIYLQPDKPRIPTPVDSRRLFLVNCPVDSTPAHFRAIFTSLVGAGRFESISFSDEEAKSSTDPVEQEDKERKVVTVAGKKRKRQAIEVQERDTSLPQTWDRPLHRSGSTAVVTLVDKKSVEAVLKAIRKLHKSSKTHPVWGAGIKDPLPPLGSARYKAHHTLRYPDPRTLQSSVDAFMTVFNAREEAAAREAKKARNVPDEDGFVTVSRGGRTGPARMEGAELKGKEMEEKEERKRKEMEKAGFYRWQGRERRKREEGELKRRFEEDRRRMVGIREGRRQVKPEK